MLVFGGGARVVCAVGTIGAIGPRRVAFISILTLMWAGVVKGDMSLISLSNADKDTFLLGVSVSESGNLYSQIDSHILQIALLALSAIVKIQQMLTSHIFVLFYHSCVMINFI